MAFQSWNELLKQHPYFLAMPGMCPMFEDAVAAALENIMLLRNEFEFDAVHPSLSLACVTLKPVSEKPLFYIYGDKPGAKCGIYFYDGTTTEKNAGCSVRACPDSV